MDQEGSFERRLQHRRARLRALWLLLAAGPMPALSAPAVWDSAPFAAPAAELQRAAAAAVPPSPANVVVLLQERRYSFDVAGRATSSMRLVYRIDSQAAVESWSSIDEYWQPWHEQKPVIRARVVTPDGVQHDLDEKYLSDTAARNDDPLIYQDTRLTQGPLPAVGVGAIVEQETRRVDTAPYFAGGTVDEINLGFNVPVLATRVVVEAPASLPMHRLLHGLKGATVAEVRDGDRVRWTLELGPLDKVDAPPELLPYDAVTVPQAAFATGASWAAVAQAYAAVTDPVLAGAEVGRLTRDLDPQLPRQERVATLVARLHRAVRYTGLEFGVSRLVPRPPRETLASGFGDCKDKSTALVAALRAVGIPAYLALLRSGPGLEVQADLPGLGTFDHAIVYVPGTPDLWIDATAEYARVGELPYDDAGRLALVVRDSTTALERTPATQPDQQLVVERREFFLPEFGNARVVETTEPHGDSESGYRNTYAGPRSEDRRKKLEEYAKNTYVADRMTDYQSTPSDDLTKPFALRLEIAGSRNAVVDVDSANMIISARRLFDRLPDLLKTVPKKNATPDPKTDLSARTHDVVFEPFASEWRYRIVLPAGYRVASMPGSSEVSVGPAKFSQAFRSEADGSVTALLRFDTVRGRYTPAEALEVAGKVAAIVDAPSPTLRFETEGQQLAAAGDVAEGLRAASVLSRQHPKEALHRVQVARVLLAAGLGEHAQAVAREATRLEPSSALAWSTLGWTLQHDAIGRRFGFGFDLEGALAAERRAVALEPKNVTWITDLAILLEFDADGVRYSPRAHLDEAVGAYRTRAKLVDRDDDGMPQNLPLLLYRLGRFPELLAAVEHPKTDLERGLVTAATAATSGTAAAIEAVGALGKGGEERSRILGTAADDLVMLRRYPEAAALLEESAHLVSGSSAILKRVEVLRATHRAQPGAAAPSDPRTVVYGMMEALLGLRANARVSDSFSKLVFDAIPAADRKQALRFWSGGLVVLQQLQNLPREVFLDIAVSNMKFTFDGDEATGLRAHVASPGTRPQLMYLVREAGEWRIAAVQQDMTALGIVALDRLAHHDLAGARVWLDWAREEVQPAGGDDPLAGPAFAHVWRKGQASDEAHAEAAATVLAQAWLPRGRAQPVLRRALETATAADERRFLQVALGDAAGDDGDWPAALAAGEALAQEYPESERAFRLSLHALQGLARWDAAQALARDRQQRLPDDLASVRALAAVAEAQHRFDDVQQLLRPVLDGGHATSREYNLYAWIGLLMRPVSKATIDAAQTAVTLDGGHAQNTLHTLACVYGVVGRGKDARDLLLQIMKESNMPEPNGAVWLGFGLIAEGDGDAESARRYYARVERGTELLVTPASTYEMARSRLAALGPSTSW